MIGKLKESNIRNCTNGKGNSVIGEEKVVDKTIEDKKAYNVQARVVNCTTLNVRDARPDKNGNLGKVKFVLKKDDIVTIGYSLNGWVSVYTNQGYGFVNKKYLEII